MSCLAEAFILCPAALKHPSECCCYYLDCLSHAAESHCCLHSSASVAYWDAWRTLLSVGRGHHARLGLRSTVHFCRSVLKCTLSETCSLDLSSYYWGWSYYWGCCSFQSHKSETYWSTVRFHALVPNSKFLRHQSLIGVYVVDQHLKFCWTWCSNKWQRQLSSDLHTASFPPWISFGQSFASFRWCWSNGWPVSAEYFRVAPCSWNCLKNGRCCWR